jgi:hypothetical protein
MSGVPNDTASVQSDRKEFRSAVRRTTFGIGIGLLLLNAGAIFAFWTTAYTSAKAEYKERLNQLIDEQQKTLDIVKKEILAEFKKQSTDLDKEARDRLAGIEKDLNGTFNASEVNKRLQQMSVEFGANKEHVEVVVKHVLELVEAAKKAATDAKKSAETAQNVCASAEQTAHEAAATARKTADNVKARFKAVENDTQIAESIRVLRKQIETTGVKPLSDLQHEIVELRKLFNEYSSGSKQFDQISAGRVVLQDGNKLTTLTSGLIEIKDGNNATSLTPMRMELTRKGTYEDQLKVNVFIEDSNGPEGLRGGLRIEEGTRINRWTGADELGRTRPME